MFNCKENEDQIKNFLKRNPGGDVVSDDGKGSISIYGETFEDENLDTQHAIAGFVSMANKGKLIIILFLKFTKDFIIFCDFCVYRL